MLSSKWGFYKISEQAIHRQAYDSIDSIKSNFLLQIIDAKTFKYINYNTILKHLCNKIMKNHKAKVICKVKKNSA